MAEHAVALMFAAARKIAVMDREIRTGRWNPAGGFQLAGRKVEVIGLCGIGSSFADMAASLGMRVVAWDQTPEPHPALVAELDEAIRGAAVVSLHLPINSATAGTTAEPACPGFILVNTAHAQLLDQTALLRGLASGRIGHAALDVFPEEPLPVNNPYVRLPNITLTAHAAHMTDAGYAELWSRTLRNYETLQRENDKDRFLSIDVCRHLIEMLTRAAPEWGE